jgi:hypothetical protein
LQVARGQSAHLILHEYWISAHQAYEESIRCGSISEQITLDTLGSADERKAELICRLISGVFSSQFGHEQNFEHTSFRSDKGQKRGE